MKILQTKQDKEEFVFWIETLRAEVLPKGTGRLFRNDCYCCLGVAESCANQTDNWIGYALPHNDCNTPQWIRVLSTLFK